MISSSGGGCGSGGKNLRCFTFIMLKFGRRFYNGSIGPQTDLPHLPLLWKSCLGSHGE